MQTYEWLFTGNYNTHVKRELADNLLTALELKSEHLKLNLKGEAIVSIIVLPSDIGREIHSFLKNIGSSEATEAHELVKKMDAYAER